MNTTGSDLVLSSGAVSNTILNSAGPELQNEVKRKKPKGIKYGEIVETSAYNLTKAKSILHGALDQYRNKEDLKVKSINCIQIKEI